MASMEELIKNYQLLQKSGASSGVGTANDLGEMVARNNQQNQANATDQAQKEAENLRRVTEQEQSRRREQQKQLIKNKKTDMLSLYGEQSKEKLSGDLSQNAKNASSRGLLYSGIKQGGEAQARGEQAADVAGYTQKVNQETDQALAGLESEGAQQGLMSHSQDIGNASDAYNRAMEKRKGANSAAASVGKSVGSILPF